MGDKGTRTVIMFVTVIKLTEAVRAEMVAHCLDAYPLEGCGLVAAPPGTADAALCLALPNAAASSRIYTIDPKDLMKADRQADDAGLEVIGVFHSHTHTAAYPSPTDVAQAPVPDWHYILVSFAEAEPAVRSFRIIDGNIDEEEVVLIP